MDRDVTGGRKSAEATGDEGGHVLHAVGEDGDPATEPGIGARSRDRPPVGPAGLVGIGNDDHAPHAGRLQLSGVLGPPRAGPARVARRRRPGLLTAMPGGRRAPGIAPSSARPTA